MILEHHVKHLKPVIQIGVTSLRNMLLKTVTMKKDAVLSVKLENLVDVVIKLQISDCTVGDACYYFDDETVSDFWREARYKAQNFISIVLWGRRSITIKLERVKVARGWA